MGTAGAYDDIADWYETEFLPGQAGSDPIGVRAALRELLGTGSGVCLEVGCGTGTHASQVRAQGWTPAGLTPEAFHEGGSPNPDDLLDPAHRPRSWLTPLPGLRDHTARP